MSEFIEMIYVKTTLLAQAYDDMNGLTLNVANLGAMLDFAGTMIGRNNSTAQSTLGALAQKLGGVGLLEVNLGSNGVTGRIGTGGIDVGGAVYDMAKRGIDYANLKQYKNSDDAKSQTIWKDYVSGDWTQENTAMRIAKGLDKLSLVGELTGVGDGGTVFGRTASSGKGRVIEILDTGDTDSMAVVLGHEAYRDGIVDANNSAETVGAVKGHTEMALRMASDKRYTNVMLSMINGNVNLQNDIGAYYTAMMNGNSSIFSDYVNNNYDSSADYWKLIVNEDGSHEFRWDGNWNIYNEDGDELVHYTELANLIKQGNKQIDLDGTMIDLKKLKFLQRYNNALVSYARENPSIASTALIEDGYMSADEATESQKEINARYKSNFWTGPNMIEHYSTRYVLNEIDALTLAVGNNVNSWMDPGRRKEDVPETLSFYSNISKDVTTINMSLLPVLKSIFHGSGNYKWQGDKAGNELVFRNGKVETDPRYIGTYNFGADMDHYNLDIHPYQFWGNSTDDTSRLPNFITKYFGRLY